MKCAACSTQICNEQHLACIKCSDLYDYACLNLSATDTNVTSESYKSNWTCPRCLSKQPKNDNTNIPARPSTPTGQADFTFNSVTRRKAQTRPETSKSISSPSDYVSREEIREIIRDEVRNALRDSVSELTRTFNTNLSDLREQLGSFGDSLNFLSDQFDGLKNEVTKCSLETNELMKENNKLRLEVDNLTNRLNIMDQMSRASNLEIQCVPESRSENVFSIVKQLCSVVKYPVTENEIAFCSRIAKKNVNSARPRAILVKFTTPRSRDCLLAAVIKYNKENAQEKLCSSNLGMGGKNIPIYVVENLTPENKSLHAAARLRAKELNYKYVWVRGG